MLHLWVREYPVSDAAEEAAISLRVAVNHLWGNRNGSATTGCSVSLLLLPWVVLPPEYQPQIYTKTNKLESISYLKLIFKVMAGGEVNTEQLI